ncbi:MAG: hypothetical protein IPG71_02785 [bacterium]|nr:hypothetical protein [bacterium]
MKNRVLLSLVCLLFALSAQAQVRLITTVEYRIDNGAFVPFDVADAASVNWAEVVPTTRTAIWLTSPACPWHRRSRPRRASE